MKTIWYDSIQNILLSITDPNTWWATYEVPWVSSPKINWWTSIYNNQSWDGQWIAWWSTDIKWTPYNWSISWSSWNISLPDWTNIAVSAWSQSISSSTYLYVDTTTWTVYATTHSYEAVWKDKLMICAAFPNSWKLVSFKAFWCADQSSLNSWWNIASWCITANMIASWTITANEIASGTITANEIAANTITSYEIAAWAIDTDELAAWAVTAGKIDVSSLSAITANLWDVYVWTNSDSEIRIYTSWSQWRIYFYYEWNTVWYMIWDYISWVWDTVAITWGSSGSWNIALNGKVWCLNRLRIPVWDNLY